MLHKERIFIEPVIMAQGRIELAASCKFMAPGNGKELSENVPGLYFLALIFDGGQIH